MAKRHLEQYDSEGHLLEIYLNDDEVMVGDKTLEEKLGEMDEEIRNAGDGTVKSVTLNGTKAEPDENGDVELELEVPEQVQADWEEDDPSDPAYIQHKPTVDDVLDEDSENAIANKTVTAAIAGLRQAIETVLGEGSTTAIENFQEVLDFLEGVTDEETLIGLLNTMNTAINGKVDKSDVYNGLDRTTVGKVLDARQGKALNDLITALQSGKSDKNATVSGVTYDTTSHKLKQTINGTTSDVANVDTAPTANSDNFVTSGGVSTALATLLSNIHIGTNGNWWVGPETDPNNDTGIKAQGPKGNSVVDGDTFDIVNNLTEGGEGDALSAEMGKWLYTNLYTIFSQLGTYAFPNGKPQIDWGGGNPPVIPPCTVSKTIGTGLSSTGGDSDVTFGDSLEVTIAITDNMYIIDDDNVVVTMGGTDITSTAWNASTQKVTIAAVTGNVVINIPSLTYVGYGEQNSPLVLHLDGKNMGSTANQWRNLCNENKPLVLSGGYTKNSDGVTFDGSSGTGKIESLGIDLPWQSSAMEAVYKQSNTTPPQVIALCGNTYNTVLCVATDGTTYIMSNCGTIPDGASALQGSNVNLLSRNYTMPYNANTVVHLVNNGGNDHYLNNVALDKETQITGILPVNFVGISTSAHNNAGEFWVSGYIARSNSYFGPLKGKLYAVRAYSRVLTASELAQNHKVDKKRFNIA